MVAGGGGVCNDSLHSDPSLGSAGQLRIVPASADACTPVTARLFKSSGWAKRFAKAWLILQHPLESEDCLSEVAETTHRVINVT